MASKFLRCELFASCIIEVQDGLPEDGMPTEQDMLEDMIYYLDTDAVLDTGSFNVMPMELDEAVYPDISYVLNDEGEVTCVYEDDVVMPSEDEAW